MSASVDESSRTAKRPRRRSRAAFGSVRKLPSGRYQARYSDAQMNRHTAPRTFASRRMAEDWLATVRADMVRGTWRAPELGSITVAEYAADLLATRVDLAPKTRQHYAELLRLWIDHEHHLPAGPGRRDRIVNIGRTQLSALNVAAVREWHAAATHTNTTRAHDRRTARERRHRRESIHAARVWALATGHEVSRTGRLPTAVVAAWHAAGKPAAPPPNLPVPDGRARVAQAYRYLHSVLQQAVRDGRLDANPCQIVGAGSTRPRERVPATPEQVAALAAAMPPRWSTAVLVAAWSGLRAGELFGLARRHVDLSAGTVRVERAVTYLPGRAPFFGETKTSSSRRTVHLPPHVVEVLSRHMDLYTAQDKDALVFADEQGHIASKDVRRVAFDRARRAVGRPDLSWHDLRHTGATIAAQAGASVRELQHRMGHATVRAAMIYQHADAARDRDLAQAMSLLAGPVGTSNVTPLRTKAAAR